MLGGEAKMSQGVFTSLVEQFGDLGIVAFQGFDGLPELRSGCFDVRLQEDRAHHHSHKGLEGLRHKAQDVAQKVHPKTLSGRLGEHDRNHLTQPLMGVTDHKLDSL